MYYNKNSEIEMIVTSEEEKRKNLAKMKKIKP
jgi:hypothetical protein